MVNLDRKKVEIPPIKKNYAIPEVYEQLGIMQHNKCYLCETKEFSPDNFHIEHFIPHQNNETLKYDWDNLFLACGDTCNYYKGTITDILNPCNEDVENLIHYELSYIDHIPEFYSADESNSKILNTCHLLNKIHNGNNEKSKLKTASLRNAIDRRAKELLIAIKSFYKATTESNEIEKQKAKNKIEKIVSRNAPYTMLMRSIARKDNFEYLFD